MKSLIFVLLACSLSFGQGTSVVGVARNPLLYTLNSSYTPTAPTTAVIGATGTAYSYKCALKDSYGNWAGISAVATVSAAATLTGAAHVQISCPTTQPAFFDGNTPGTWTVLRTASAGTPATVGILTGCSGIALTTAPTCDDTGLVGDAQTLGSAPPGVVLTGTAADVGVFTWTVPGGLLGTKNCLRAYTSFSHSTGSATVTYNLKYGGSTLQTGTSSAAGFSHATYIMCNTGTTNSQASFGPFIATTTNTTVDSTAAQTFTLTWNVAATDKVTLTGFTIELIQRY